MQKRLEHEQTCRAVSDQQHQDRYIHLLHQQCGDGEEEDEGPEVFDSLDVAAAPPHHHTPLSHTEYLDTHMDERHETSITDDAYSELRYDPDWRTNLREAGRFDNSSQELYDCNEESSLGPVIKGGYRYIVDSGPAVVLTPRVNEPDRPYRLHPQDAHTTSAELRPAEGDHTSTSNEQNTTSQKGFRKIHEPAEDHVSRSPGLTEDGHAANVRELRHRSGPDHTQKTFRPPRKPDRPTEDIVERNKATLGRITTKHGSYVSVHALKQETPRHGSKVREALKEAAGAGSPEDGSEPELMWLQKTQQLRVTKISRGKKAQRKQYPGPPQPQRAPGVSAERGDSLSPPSAGPAAVTQTHHQPPSLPPTIHLNINLNTAPLLPLIQHRGHDQTINLASLHGCPQWSPASEDGLTLLSPGCPRKHPGKASQMFRKGLNAHLQLERRPEQRALKWPLSCQKSPDETPDEGPTNRTSTDTSSLGSYTVVPPIGGSVRGDDPEPVARQRSSSEGYLAQMERQKQLRARATYKAYSLKDYKQLQSDVNLRGLGPDFTVIEKTAEKMKRQKLYSNVIREQNKKISRIPFLPAKEPEGSEKKVPRMKALEYARTISRPAVQPQPRQRQTHLEDSTQLSTLELLRRRHEEEKQAVALFRKVHAV